MFSNRRDIVVVALGAVMIGVVTVVDFTLSGNIAVSLVHAAVMLTGLAARDIAVTLLLATLGSLATVAAGALHMQETTEAATFVNRGMSLMALWIVAALVCFVRRSSVAGTQDRGIFEKDDITRAVFDQTFQFVAALDAKGNVIEANQTLRDYAGLTANEIRAMTIWLLPIFQTDPAAQERLQAAVSAAAAGHFIRDEFDVSGLGDEPTVIDLSLKPIRDEDGTVSQIIMEARDVTEARLQQEMLAQAQKMEAVGELTAGVAHDFNNLLTIIVGNLELLEKHLKGNPKAEDRVARAIRAAFRGQALTQQLLAFSRRQALDPAVLDVNTLLCGMSEMFKSLGDNVQIEFDLADDLPLCEVDPTLLETALLNIAINARDAMPDGGKLRFQTARTVFDDAYSGEVADLPAGDYICIAISDTGEGIDEDIISQVFDPFFTTKGVDDGTGLGLSMVYGFVRQSKGDVKIYSEKGKGTTVRLYLPATDKPLRMVEPATHNNVASKETRGKRVLLVEDDDEIRGVVSTALREIGCHVEVATSGDTAIELIRAGSEFDLIFSDVVMAGDANGPDVARAARAANPGLPVIFCSGFPRNTVQEDERSIEGTYFLGKPFQRDSLVEIVERALLRAKAL